MTYIGIREKAGHHTRRAVADRKVEEWKEKMEKESRGALIGSWLWRFHFSCFFVFRFSLLDKGNKKMRRRWKAQMPESPHGLLCIHTKNKMTAIIKVITKSLSWAWATGVETAPVFSVSCGLLWGHVSRSEASHPEMYSHNKGRVESVRLFIWQGHYQKGLKGLEMTQVCSGWDTLRLFGFFYFFFIFCWFFHHWPQSLIIACSFRQCTSKVNCQGCCIKMTSLLAIPECTHMKIL